MSVVWEGVTNNQGRVILFLLSLSVSPVCVCLCFSGYKMSGDVPQNVGAGENNEQLTNLVNAIRDLQQQARENQRVLTEITKTNTPNYLER